MALDLDQNAQESRAGCNYPMGVFAVFMFCRRLVANLFTSQKHSVQASCLVSAPAMNPYALSVAITPGTALEDAKAHHVKTKDGRPVLFNNPFPSFGWAREASLLKSREVPRPAGGRGKALAARGTDALLKDGVEQGAEARGELDIAARVAEPRGTQSSSACGARRHHDHLSLPSVKELVRAYPGVHFFIGMGLPKWFHDSRVSAVTEMDWWDDADVVLERRTASEAGIDAGQGAGDDGSSPPERISVRSGGKSVWFAGDTGYRPVPEGMEELGPGFDELPRNPQFAQIGSLRGPFDLGLIPIGAYQPRFMYGPVHASPYDAVEIFQDTKCRRALGIHLGHVGSDDLQFFFEITR
ncbi:beta-lactamase superfamily domain-containing protein [Lasiosphaeria ovina]|uniref:Beta-lactamase superfamily domain-containing protein n=1 Tax=Lasiosphaeria ovina TaxID=92902 RepID=A0AAE0KMV1_9PEZI|nr:beta-lactamase superfamily domain-containing protein [Lasiosphaeria ovina]